uniref:Uncharacterized protein n=1 Tax=Mastacembelus armatus TaxID=205130 RepID=A0A3Q3SHX3_9TELE
MVNITHYVFNWVAGGTKFVPVPQGCCITEILPISVCLHEARSEFKMWAVLLQNNLFFVFIRLSCIGHINIVHLYPATCNVGILFYMGAQILKLLALPLCMALSQKTHIHLVLTRYGGLHVLPIFLSIKFLQTLQLILSVLAVTSQVLTMSINEAGDFKLLQLQRCFYGCGFNPACSFGPALICMSGALINNFLLYPQTPNFRTFRNVLLGFSPSRHMAPFTSCFMAYELNAKLCKQTFFYRNSVFKVI